LSRSLLDRSSSWCQSRSWCWSLESKPARPKLKLMSEPKSLSRSLELKASSQIRLPGAKRRPCAEEPLRHRSFDVRYTEAIRLQRRVRVLGFVWYNYGFLVNQPSSRERRYWRCTKSEQVTTTQESECSSWGRESSLDP
jgi:hypothetical protein